MGILEKLRPLPRWKHADPAVRAASVYDLGPDEAEALLALAREDAEARVRRAAVTRLDDPAVLGEIARTDPDEDVRAEAIRGLAGLAAETDDVAHATAVVRQLVALGRMKEVVRHRARRHDRRGSRGDRRPARRRRSRSDRSAGTRRTAPRGCARSARLTDAGGSARRGAEVGAHRRGGRRARAHLRSRGARCDRAAGAQQGGGAPRRARSFGCSRRRRARLAAGHRGRGCGAEDRAAGARDCCIAPKGSSRCRIPTPRRRRSRKRVWRGPSSRPTSTRSMPSSTQQFEAASDAVREAIAERQQERAAEQERADALAREQADRVIICQQIESAVRRRGGRSDRRAEGAVGRPGADAVGVRRVAEPPVPGRLPRVRGSRAPAHAGARRGRPARDAGHRARAARRPPISRSRRSSPAGAACAATPTCCASTPSANPAAAERLERAVADARGEGAPAPAGPRQAGAGQPEAAAAGLPPGRNARRRRADHAEGRRSRAARHPHRARGARAAAVEEGSAGHPGAARGGARHARPARPGAARRRRVAALGQPPGAGRAVPRDGGAQGRGEPRNRRAAACASCRGAGSRSRWRRARRARRCGAASRRRRTRSSRARPPTSRRRTRSAHGNLARKQALTRARRGAGGLDRLGEDRHRDPEAAGRVEDDRPGDARSREGGLGAVPRRVRPVLHAAAGRPEAAQGRLVRQPRAEGSALREGRGAGRFDRMGCRGVAAEAAAGRVEDGRAGAQVEVRGGLAAVPDRVRSLLRSLQASRPGGPAGEGGAARSDHPRARGAAAPRAAGRWRRRGRRDESRAPTIHDARGALAAGARAAARRSSRTSPRAITRRSAAWWPRGRRRSPAPISIPSTPASGWRSCWRASRSWSSAQPKAQAPLSPTELLAQQWRERLAANTMTGSRSAAETEDARWRAAEQEVRNAQAQWTRLGPVPPEVAGPLNERFQRACRRFYDQRGALDGRRESADRGDSGSRDRRIGRPFVLTRSGAGLSRPLRCVLRAAGPPRYAARFRDSRSFLRPSQSSSTTVAATSQIPASMPSAFTKVLLPIVRAPHSRTRPTRRSRRALPATTPVAGQGTDRE